MTLPPVLSLGEVQSRLNEIFPEGTPNRANCVRDTAAKIVFVMLYIGALEGSDVWMRPDQVRRMTDAQAAQGDDQTRAAWRTASMKGMREAIIGAWHAVNTRESVRDESLRFGLVANGAVITRDIPTTSSLGRYALQSEFAALFEPALAGNAFAEAAAAWRQKHLNPTALARVILVQQGTTKSGDPVFVTLPNGETRRMSPGPSSVLSKAVIEAFAPRFLHEPGLIWLSESAMKVVTRDDVLAKSIGLVIAPERHLPDIILVDAGGPTPRLVFIEVVNTDGHVTDIRKQALLAYAAEAGFPPEQVSFVTAYHDRGHQAFRKTVSSLAWGAYAWFMSEPDYLMELADKPPKVS